MLWPHAPSRHAVIAQHAVDWGGVGIIVGMHAPVVDGEFGEIEGAEALKAGCVDAVFVWVGAALVVRVDAAGFAKKMLGLAG